MGGKAKLLDPITLEALYIESIKFRSNSEETSNKLRVLVNKLTDPLFLHNIKNEESNRLIETIMASKQSLEDLLESLNATGNYVDSTLEGTIRHTEEFHNESDKVDNPSSDEKFNLKR
ncbi:hypothetical protein SH1V18_11350 [Vallitalea longa]|uniref:Uncharacterized protein n=1 Tax=Vallitalea longa TaxID=2936439 RepID=A0A9W5Y9R7_9FIRM|nr:hypothetical protein [Vallitalea longa]GKX28655.1 hypothetical protein SH1V18_11350 [Vallitalea longa]